jgi:N-acetylmuramoyl-L-alanine amidase
MRNTEDFPLAGLDAGVKNRAKTDYIVIHCSATTASQDVGAAWMDRLHRKQGWRCIGYHFVIKRDGTLEAGRLEKQVGSHVSGHNANSLGICMAGGVTDSGRAVNNYTKAQWDTLKRLVKYLKAKPEYRNAKVQGHRDFPKVQKDCPCFDVKAWWESAQQEA